MGFRSTFITEGKATATEWPQWFVEKYGSYVWFGDDHRGVIASSWEGEAHSVWRDLPQDIQKAINWNKVVGKFVLVYLHECRGITRVEISENSIKFSEPISWEPVSEITHGERCYGCSDVSPHPEF